MKKYVIILILGIVLLTAGAIVGGISLASIGFDFSRLSTGTYSARSFDVAEDFQDIRIKGVSENIQLAPSEDGKCRVDCYDHDKVSFDVRVDGSALLIEADDRSQWFEHIGFFTKSRTITVYLPRDSYGSFQADLVTGDVEFAGLHFDGDISIQSTTGDVRLAGVTCRSILTESNTGDVLLTDVIASDNMHLIRNTGDILFKDADAGSIIAVTNTGDVTGTLRSAKAFSAHTTTGDIDVPDGTAGGSCQITTVTGDIAVKVQN